MADNIPLDRDVEGTIVYPLSDETGLRLDETVDTRLYQIYEALLGNSSVGTQIDGSLNAQLGQIYVALLGYGDTFTQIKDAIDAGMGSNEDAILSLNETMDTGLGQVCVKLDGSSDALDARLGQIYQALLDDGYVLPTATDSLLGGVKIDGVTIQIRNGVISVVNPLEYMSAETIVRLTPFGEPGQIPEGSEEPLEDQVYVEDDVMYMLSSSAEGAIGISVRDGYVNLDAPTDVVDVLDNDVLQIYTDGTTVLE